MGIFDKRVAFKPFTYDLLPFREAIRINRWDVEEFDFSVDIQDFKIKMEPYWQQVAKRSMLVISQIEAAAVKDFWGHIGDVIQLPEVKLVGYTFSENEITHSLAYSKLLEVLGFNNEFEELLTNDVIKDRVNYLDKYIHKKFKDDKRQYAITLALFSLFVENVSLFSQFLIVKSFKRNLNLLQSIDNVILSTQKDELVHANFGIHILNIIRKEYPDWFNSEFYDLVYKACKKAYIAECKIIDWIYEGGDLLFLQKQVVKTFIANRFNESLKEIGGKDIFEVDSVSLQSIQWFDEEIYAYTRNDFFNSKSSNYNKISVKSNNIKNSLTRIKNELV